MSTRRTRTIPLKRRITRGTLMNKEGRKKSITFCTLLSFHLREKKGAGKNGTKWNENGTKMEQRREGTFALNPHEKLA